MGIMITLPCHTYGHIAPHSGLAVKHGIDVGAGVINHDYTGELKVLLVNHSSKSFMVTPGDHIAQLIVETYQVTQPWKVDTLKSTSGGDQGFGSTGMTSELVAIYAIEFMPTATQEKLCSMVPSKYQNYLDVFDPEAQMKQLPISCPAYDFAIELDPMKPLLKPAQPYHLNAEE
jgi:hypothetical protein